MAQRHRDRKQYFDEQSYTTKKYVLPYIEKYKRITSDHRVLEIGCGEGGNMRPFLELGCEVIGVDINSTQLDRGRAYYESIETDGTLKLIDRNIYDMSASEVGEFDFIVLRDVIEHIPNQFKFMGHLRSFLKPEGIVFFGFPPWYMPFGGHQQMCRTKLGKLPYIHLLPRSLYASYLKLVGEHPNTVETRLEIYDTGITIERFSEVVRKNGYRFLDRTLYLINPNYEAKFNLRPRRQFMILRSIPYLRNLWTTCCYAIIAKT